MYKASILKAIFAALLFGIAPALTKSVTSAFSPLMIAGILYLGSGIGLSGYLLWKRPPLGEWQELGKAWKPAMMAIVLGGAVGPGLMVYGLSTTPAATASLILTLEGVFTALIAWVLFKEHFHIRIGTGMLFVVAGAMVLSFSGKPEPGQFAGLVALFGACFAWGLDNNYTRMASHVNSTILACCKGLAAGAANVILAISLGAPLPATGVFAQIGVIGLLCYGTSLIFFIEALRGIGVSRTAAYFGLAPFAGVIFSVAWLGEGITLALIIASVLVALGIWLHITEKHDHEHAHPQMNHAHWHEHDEHHQHRHSWPWDPSKPHGHPHCHAPVVHTHGHFPDLHHRHTHLPSEA